MLKNISGKPNLIHFFVVVVVPIGTNCHQHYYLTGHAIESAFYDKNQNSFDIIKQAEKNQKPRRKHDNYLAKMIITIFTILW